MIDEFLAVTDVDIAGLRASHADALQIIDGIIGLFTVAEVDAIHAAAILRIECQEMSGAEIHLIFAQIFTLGAPLPQVAGSGIFLGIGGIDISGIWVNINAVRSSHRTHVAYHLSLIHI